MSSAPGQPTAHKWVLVVDDDAAVRTVWIEALTDGGYTAVGCRDGAEAAELIGDLFPDLIVLDLRMRGASGWHLLRVIGANPNWHRIPVLIVSGYLAEEPDLDPAAHAGANIVGRMAKPLGGPELLAKVEELIGPPARPGA